MKSVSDNLYLVSKSSPFPAQSMDIPVLSSVTCSDTCIIYAILICSGPLSGTSVIVNCSMCASKPLGALLPHLF